MVKIVPISTIKYRQGASILSVLIIMAASALIILITVKIFTDARPERGIVIFLLFLAVQVIAIARTWIRCWRYAAVSELARANAGI